MKRVSLRPSDIIPFQAMHPTLLFVAGKVKFVWPLMRGLVRFRTRGEEHELTGIQSTYFCTTKKTPFGHRPPMRGSADRRATVFKGEFLGERFQPFYLLGYYVRRRRARAPIRPRPASSMAQLSGSGTTVSVTFCSL